jgi:hypothetical protein
MEHVWHVIYFYFVWPYGAVWGNVWAILPCGLIGFIAGAKLGQLFMKDLKNHITLEHQKSRQHLENLMKGKK